MFCHICVQSESVSVLSLGDIGIFIQYKAWVENIALWASRYMCDAQLLNLLYAHFALDPWDIDTLYLSVDGFENLGYKPQNRIK